MSFKVVVVDGIIGVGKTTLIQILKSQLEEWNYKVVVVKENVDKWIASGILEKFYKDKARWSYTFQTMAFRDRVQTNVECFNEHGSDVDFYILERSCVTDQVFMRNLHEEGFVSDLEMELYNEWKDMWVKLMPYNPSLFIYLRSTVEVAMERVRQRDRPSERSITHEYQADLLRKHDELLLSCDSQTNVPHQALVDISPDLKVKCIVYDASLDYISDSECRRALVGNFLSQFP